MKTREGAPLTRVRLSPHTLQVVQARDELRDRLGNELEYDVVDVFTERAFAGNPLAVVHGTEGLDDRALQALAREFNLSETAFPTPCAGDAYRLRIFTPVTELPFAGHPSLGAAWALARRGLVVGPALLQTCAAGTMSVELGDDGLVRLTGGPPSAVGVVDPRLPLAAVGLAPSDLVGPPGAARPAGSALVTGTGLDFCYLLVRPDAVARAVPDLAALGGVAESAGRPVGGVVVAAWSDGAAHVRVFADDIGVPEDPATGSAALGLSVALVAAGLVPAAGRTEYAVRQGAEIGRPSSLRCVVEASDARAVRCQVGGFVTPVARGTIVRPA